MEIDATRQRSCARGAEPTSYAGASQTIILCQPSGTVLGRGRMGGIGRTKWAQFDPSILPPARIDGVEVFSSSVESCRRLSKPFFFDVLAQLPPDLRPVFMARVVEQLQARADPGPGDIDRALRAALFGLWTPPAITELRPSRWDRDAPRFDRTSKRAW